ncbi:heme ABC exporter ATP-binding protein CcmA [Pseudaestuariivita atlantica]|uniref:Cytochrome C biogenesis protein CcmA n=1 Tax=Pseudaestuariivita atlantica TaxID=1317121 RepID=A0A0L1JV78_9RHOB|nr:heme ABC exporter ATP-binding protein CcmA [Pseudaestuariivita atlantica]KNG95671.1 cytochrome C biogenesis protein CcmA [Pseudaestuariivita atlantica]
MRAVDLAVGRGGTPVLEGLSFEVAAGEALILRGPNGAGKTTLLRTLVGLMPPMEGRVEADPDTLAYSGHADGIKPTLTVAENLSFWAQVFDAGGIEAALDAFDLRALADRPAGRLSAGQKRRLGLSRMLVADRAVWVMDEPTVSLDAATVEALAGLLRARLAAGGALIVATHIDIGLDARVLDVGPFRAAPRGPVGFDEAFA